MKETFARVRRRYQTMKKRSVDKGRTENENEEKII